MNLLLYLKFNFNFYNLYNKLFSRKKRYNYLIEAIRINKCKNLMEIGTWNGNQAINMIEEAKKNFPAASINYYGFDLFELLDEKIALEELTKVPPPMEKVKKKLEKTGANIFLYKGNTKEILPKVVKELPKMDFVFIDGGHSLDTIKSDWNNVQKLMDNSTIVIFDDYYHNREDVGCQKIIKGIDKNFYEVEILPIKDIFKSKLGILEISFVQVKKK